MTGEQVYHFLIKRVKKNDLIKEMVIRFYEDIFAMKLRKIDLDEKINSYDTVKSLFVDSTETFSLYEEEIIQDVFEHQEHIINDYFYHAEEEGVTELLLNHKKEITKFLAEQSGKEITDLDEEQIQRYYQKSFEAYDRYKKKMFGKILEQNPVDMYNMGKKYLEVEKKKSNILLTEEDFIIEYLQMLDENRLQDSLAKHFYNSVKFGQRFELDFGDAEDPLEAEDAFEGVLNVTGDFDIQDYRQVYEFMHEYTGKRVYPVEEELIKEAYWSTYEEVYKNMMIEFLYSQLPVVVEKILEQDVEGYMNFIERYGISKKELKSSDAILERCDRLNYEINCLFERLWNDFAEQDAEEVYQKGEKL